MNSHNRKVVADYFSLHQNCQFKKKLNAFCVMGVGFSDLNCHLIDSHLIGQTKSKHVISHGIKSFAWIVSRLFRKKLLIHTAPTLLVPAELGKERSVGLFTPIFPFLAQEEYKVVPVNQMIRSINFRTFLRWTTLVPSIVRDIFKVFKEEELKAGIAEIKWQLLIDSLVHTLCICQFSAYYKRITCKSVLVDWDRHKLQALVVIAAKLEGVRSYTFVHGAIYTPQKFVPLIADYCLVWGKKHVEFFTGQGEDPKKLLIAGNTRFNHELPDRLSVLNKYQIPPKKRIILHASQNFPDVQDHEIVEKLAKMVACDDRYLLLIKSHPSQDQTRLKTNIAGVQNVILLPVNISAKEALSLSSFTIIVSSTFAIDAMIAGIPVAIYQPLETLRGIAVELVEEANVPLLRSVEDMAKLFSDVDSRGINACFNMEAQRHFIKTYCEYYGTEAAAIVATALTA